MFGADNCDFDLHLTALLQSPGLNLGFGSRAEVATPRPLILHHMGLVEFKSGAELTLEPILGSNPGSSSIFLHLILVTLLVPKQNLTFQYYVEVESWRQLSGLTFFSKIYHIIKLWLWNSKIKLSFVRS